MTDSLDGRWELWTDLTGDHLLGLLRSQSLDRPEQLAALAVMYVMSPARLIDPGLPAEVGPEDWRPVTVDVEWTPEPASHLQDRTSFDVVVRHDNATYREVALRSAVWIDPSDPDLAAPAVNQIWRNHLLVESIRQRATAPGLIGCQIVVGHPGDGRCWRQCDRYVKHLRTPEAEFRTLPLDRIVATWRPLVEGSRYEQWLADFSLRYLELDRSHDAWLESRPTPGSG